MNTRMLNLVLSLSVICGMTALTAQAAGDHDHPHAKVGHKAPDFTLTDTTGKQHALASYTAAGKIVVLEWFNHDCPVCKKHAEEATMVKIAEKYADKGVVMLGVDSTSFHEGKESDINTKVKEWKLNYPILADFDGKVGHMYGAKTTPHMFIIHKDGTLVYDGAIDDRGETNYVTQALDQILAGETVARSKTKPYGCSVKYKKK